MRWENPPQAKTQCQGYQRTKINKNRSLRPEQDHQYQSDFDARQEWYGHQADIQNQANNYGPLYHLKDTGVKLKSELIDKPRNTDIRQYDQQNDRREFQ